MKVIYQILLLSVILWTSCEDTDERIPDNIPCKEYEYQMPDLSKTTAVYQIDTVPQSLIEHTKKYVEEHGFVELFSFGSKGYYCWESSVMEIGEDGDTIYTAGDIPFKRIANQNIKKIKVGYKCFGHFSAKLQYYPLFSFWFDKDFELSHATPFTQHISITPEDEYAIKYHCLPYIIRGSGHALNITHDLGCDFLTYETTIVEKDNNGNILYQGEPKNAHEYSMSEDGAKQLEVSIDFYGRPTGSTTILHLGILKYEIPLKESDANDISLINYQYTLTLDDNKWYIINLGGPSSINIVKDMGYNFSKSGITKIIEKDADGNIQMEKEIEPGYYRSEWAFAKKETRTVDVYIDCYGWIDIAYNNNKVATIKFENIPLNNGANDIDLNNCQYTIETISPDELQHRYKVILGGPSTIDIVKGMGYDFASSGIAKIVEKDKDGKILYNGLRTSHPGLEYSIAAKGTKTVDVFIDFYGRHGSSSSEKLGSIKFENIPLNEYGETIIYLDNYPYTVCTEDLTHQYKIETSGYYFVTGNGYSPSEIKEQVKNMGYDYVSSEMTGVIERDIKGTVLYQGEIKKPNGYSISEEGARTIDILIDYYGWTDANTNKTKVLTVIIHNISLNKFGETDISPYNQSYTIEY